MHLCKCKRKSTTNYDKPSRPTLWHSNTDFLQLFFFNIGDVTRIRYTRKKQKWINWLIDIPLLLLALLMLLVDTWTVSLGVLINETDYVISTIFFWLCKVVWSRSEVLIAGWWKQLPEYMVRSRMVALKNLSCNFVDSWRVAEEAGKSLHLSFCLTGGLCSLCKIYSNQCEKA